MSELISGKEALIALTNGEGVQYKFPDGIWMDFTTNLNLRGSGLKVVDFLNDHAEFRLKPRTVNLNGIEVPSVKYVAHSGGNCVKISCECPEDAAAIGAALRSIFNPQ